MALRFADLVEMGKKPLSEVIAFSQNRGLIARAFNCSVCGNGMVLRAQESASDKHRWRCMNCKTTKSVRTGSWFHNSKLPMVKILHLTYCWVHKYQQNLVQWEIQCSNHTTVDWYNFCREVCVDVVLGQNMQIGGPGTIVEIDESKFGKRKYNRGKHVEGQWVFGGVERGSNRCFLTTVTDRSSATLVPLIQKFIAPGTTIISDCWKSYDCLGEEGYKHLTVNHSVTFKDPETGACTNSIEGLWSCVKRQMPDCNRSKGLFSSYLGEFMYRRLRADSPDLFEAFLQDSARVYPPPTNDVDAEEETDAES